MARPEIPREDESIAKPGEDCDAIGQPDQNFLAAIVSGTPVANITRAWHESEPLGLNEAAGTAANGCRRRCRRTGQACQHRSTDRR
jgi:hypothetical protein